MCGLSAILDLTGQRLPEAEQLTAMTRALAHRGPDGEGMHREPGVGLGHRRLSIIDLAGGAQPLWNEDRSVAVVFNGEIYNFPDLMQRLQGLGHQFHSRSDTEVIVHAWEQWGEQCVEALQGMFAFALWDRCQGVLFVARDRLGIKPLYYGFSEDGWLLVGSELKALTAHPGLSRSLDPKGVMDYFAYGYIPDPHSIYRQVKKLEPGYCARFTLGSGDWRLRCYWDLSFAAQPLTEAAALQQLQELLGQTVQSHTLADVPLGAFLSGGVDSSLITALLAKQSQTPLQALTVAFTGSREDEAPHARAVAQHLGVQQQLLTVDPLDFERLERLPGLYDEPFADSSAWPTFLLCEAAASRMKVVLSGDGGDELCAGYSRYRLFMAEQQVRQRVPSWLRRGLFGPMGMLYPKLDNAPRWLRAKSTLQALGEGPLEGLFRGASMMDPAMGQGLLAPDLMLLDYHPIEHFYRLNARLPEQVAFHDRMLYLDFKTFLAGRVLTKVDRASMAVGLEVRVPLLDHRLVEWAGRLPWCLKMQGGQGKYLLKKLAAQQVPATAVYRSKQGFIPPLAAWLRGPLQERLQDRLSSRVITESGLFHPRWIHWMLEQHRKKKQDLSMPLWSLLMFEGMLRKAQNKG
ncbi:asparagine synthase (glutamine-hydrolyzing) [Magnetococcus marinus MC-1]|uniref:asparagine synthase (glutamine-hydrolyzing) n=1 Tax=Magnetococcus marinus (strain ATCC BAA-1437 / JCM 17883 / MC-1) TaxID=156889 RepID=A0L574_MAGMM|nr:XrtA/PEP-CTERM system amidotransferase [Magnetococcus marinus]ABK43117.1 asparagine synthase (glutamine-hydrolyzing) [Magnetococcus marinus MC-1]